MQGYNLALKYTTEKNIIKLSTYISSMFYTTNLNCPRISHGHNC